MNQHPGNERRNLVNHHLVEALRGAIAEAEGDVRLSQRLHAETKLRLIRMSGEDLWELAKRLSLSPENSAVEAAYQQYRKARFRAYETASEWIGYLLIDSNNIGSKQINEFSSYYRV